MRLWRWCLAPAAASVVAFTGLAAGAASAATTGPGAGRSGSPGAPVAIHLAPKANAVAGKRMITLPSTAKINRNAANNLLYNGGQIQRDPEVYLLFWGSWWAANPSCPGSPGNGVSDEQYLYSFYNGLATSSDQLSPIASQYYQDGNTFPTFPTLAGKAFITWNVDCSNPPQAATQGQLAAEADSYAAFLASEGYPITNNTQIVVVSPSGYNPDGFPFTGFCAYHSWVQYSAVQNISWTNLPFIPDAGASCGANFVQNGNDGWSIVGGHEYMESTTDPFLNAWYDSAGNEVGDKCAWTNLFVQKTSTGLFAMQPEWDNRTSSCQKAWTYLNGRLRLSPDNTFCAQGSSLSANTPVTLHTPCDTNTIRSWVRYPDGSLRRFKNTGMCIQPAGGSTATGAPLVLSRCNNGAIQSWAWSSRTLQWRNAASGLCLRAPVVADGQQLTQDTCGLNDGTEKWSNL
jgi:Ricin-type beta-trefoil lectin domain